MGHLLAPGVEARRVGLAWHLSPSAGPAATWQVLHDGDVVEVLEAMPDTGGGATAIVEGLAPATDAWFQVLALDPVGVVVAATPLLEVRTLLELPCASSADCPTSDCTVGSACIEGWCVPFDTVEGSPCDDGDGCTGADACVAGMCLGSALGSACEEAVAASAADALLQDLQPYSAKALVDAGIEVAARNADGGVRSLHGADLALSPSLAGCSGDTPKSVACLLGALAPTLGVATGLEHLGTRSLPGGFQALRYRQIFEGYRVRGADVVAIVDSDGLVRVLYNRTTFGLGPDPSLGDDLAALFAAAGAEQGFTPLIAAADLDGKDVLGATPVLYRSGPPQAPVARPAVAVRLGPDAALSASAVLLDAETAETIAATAPNEYAAHLDVRSAWVPLDITTEVCEIFEEPPPPDSCWPDAECLTSQQLATPLCGTRCTSDAECASLAGSPEWDCMGVTPESGEPGYFWTLDGWCALEAPSWGPWLPIYHDTGGWTDPAYPSVGVFDGVQELLEDVRAYHYDDLGRLGFDDADGPYQTGVTLPAGGGEGMAYCGGYSLPANCWVRLYSVFGFGDIHDDDAALVDSADLLSHEWAHNIILVDLEGEDIPDSDCMGETVPSILGAMFAADRAVEEHGGTLSASEIQWSSSFPESCGPSSWQNNAWLSDPKGLGRPLTCNAIAPYALRSAFDRVPCGGGQEFYDPLDGGSCDTASPFVNCGAYLQCALDPKTGTNRCGDKASNHNNRPMWRRFLRILVDGSDALATDATGEDIGLSTTPVAWSTANALVYCALQQATSTTTSHDWVASLRACATVYSVDAEVEQALGAIGYPAPPDRLVASGGASAREPVGREFPGWVLTYDHAFEAWTSPAGHVYLKGPAQWRSTPVLVGTSAASAPSLMADAGFLYVFWRRATDSVMMRLLRSDGTWAGIYDLGTAEITTEGTFDTTRFADHLYLVHVGAADGKISLSKCPLPSSCLPSSWVEFSPGVRQLSLGIDAHPGLGAIGADRVHGGADPSEEYLYLVSSFDRPGDPDDDRIRFDLVDTTDTLLTPTEGSNVAFLWEHYPSHKTVAAIGIEAVESAFPSTGKYIYLAWRALETGTMFLAVVQRWDDVDPTASWVTRSHDTGMASETGARWHRGLPPTAGSRDFYFSDIDAAASALHGRY